MNISVGLIFADYLKREQSASIIVKPFKHYK